MTKKFIIYLFTLIRVNGVLLPYVVQEKDNPDSNGDFPNFIENKIACVPLKGNYYEADFNTVYQALVSFKTGNSSEYWTDDTLWYRDGMISMKSLRARS